MHLIPGTLVLENEKARLEPLAQKHFDTLWEIAQEKELWRFTSVKVNSEADFKRYFDTALDERTKNVSYPFAIFDKTKNAYAGSTRYGNIVPEHKRLEIGWTWYGSAFQRTGLNRYCKLLLLDHAFDVLGMNRVELKTSLTNNKSQQAMRNIGAVQEGILRRHMINEDGELRDSVYFSFIREEWQDTRATFFKNYL